MSISGKVRRVSVKVLRNKLRIPLYPDISRQTHGWKRTRIKTQEISIRVSFYPRDET